LTLYAQPAKKTPARLLDELDHPEATVGLLEAGIVGHVTLAV